MDYRMFFRRAKLHQSTFTELVTGLKEAGFETQLQGSGAAKVSKYGCAAMLKDIGQPLPEVGKAGIAVGDEIGLLVDGGFQKFFLTPNGHKVPALAVHLKAIHNFEEDLKEGLGMISLYNQSLGTTCDLHYYDRVEDRDHGVPTRPWEESLKA